MKPHPFATIIALGLFAAILYGVAHDMVTAHVCVEYFTIGHPPVFHTDSPILLALGWGVIATWWVGFPLGILLALAARAGSSRPKLSARQVAIPLAWLLLGMCTLALTAGIAGYLLAMCRAIWLVGELAERVPPERHAVFLADMWAHTASYAAGILGGLGLAVWLWRKRRHLNPATRSGSN